MTFFRDITKSTRGAAGARNAAVMGRRTWAGIPPAFRPLRGRVNALLSLQDEKLVREQEGLDDSTDVFASLSEAVSALRAREGIETIHVVGGAAAFSEAIEHGIADVLYVTRVLTDHDTDVRMSWPLAADAAYKQVAAGPVVTEGAVEFQFTQWVNTKTASAVEPVERADGFSYSSLEPSPEAGLLTVPSYDDAGRSAIPDIAALAAAQAPGVHPEQQYLALIRDILCTGVQRGDRTGTGTLSKFGVQMRFSLRDGVLPLLTTKRVFWRGVAEELLWFVSGNTSAAALQEKGVHIWDGNGSREFLDKSGLGHREEGDLGPVYGFQWRHFGAEYTDMHADYTGKGVDQLQAVVDKIRTNPTDRRIILSAWNPAAIPEMALPPCHMFAQFFVANGELSCQMYQRSADMGLGVPFNIASYSLLTVMLAHVTGLKPGDFVHVIGDAHVYLNHVDALRIQLAREPRPFPTLRIDREVAEIDDFKFSDFVVEGYKPDKSIKMKMAV
ncbi:hypothetical protein FNF31_00376 [Cafeteria roenbergensis]|uniref:Bifunctional dihydrofolate reductase-thymidylate synthase n=1 Tax=Cafeteria roenbergensis TaxID=33653 RepID=A0A5A8E151_CAFRO|nr:hypothetical protein FNF31_00376 [Cafeteria roenbergensis]KAA0171219.1 hypothetical protein FNF28_00985 [Cafeteria roenbergensis]